MSAFSYIVPQSYWQRGCNDALEGRPYSRPLRQCSVWDRENHSYGNGWRFGREKLFAAFAIGDALRGVQS